MELSDGSTVGIIGGGPAGSFTGYFLLEFASRVGLKLQIDIYDYKDFSKVGPIGCNHCGGIISETLVQMLAAEGIMLHSGVVRRGLDSYVLHTDVGSVRIETPTVEKRIAAVYRGGGPLKSEAGVWESFDGHLLNLVLQKGANLIRSKVETLEWEDGRPVVHAREMDKKTYDLLIGAVGINSTSVEMFQMLGTGYRIPDATKTYISEFQFSKEVMDRYLGTSMHVFLTGIANIEFAALIPKGTHATLCLVGKDITNEILEQFLTSPEVLNFLPDGLLRAREAHCKCIPRINIGGVRQPFGDRVAIVGDSGATRLYKDGIGAAYRTAKACAATAVFQGISHDDFARHYWPACRQIIQDNSLGKIIFEVVSVIRRYRFFRRMMLGVTEREQKNGKSAKRMSKVLWDTFTGSAPYREILKRTLHPFFLMELAGECLRLPSQSGRGKS